jgi:DNA-binding MarR family transcriptional regulator
MSEGRPEPERLQVWRLLLQVHARLVDVLGDELEAEVGMPLSWYDVLLNLHEAPGGALRMNDLADAVLLSRSGLTRLVDRLVSAGLVQRQVCASDRRGALAALTPDGLTALRRAAPVHLRGVQARFTSQIGDDELPVVQAVLDRVLAAAGTAAGTAAGPARGAVSAAAAAHREP